MKTGNMNNAMDTNNTDLIFINDNSNGESIMKSWFKIQAQPLPGRDNLCVLWS